MSLHYSDRPKWGAEQHAVSKPKRVWYPTRMVFVDTETTRHKVSEKSLKHSLRLGFACYVSWQDKTRKDTEVWYDFVSAGAFWDWALGRAVSSTPLLIVGHNLKFDFLVLDGLRELSSRGWLVYSLYEKGMTFLLRAGLPSEGFAAHLKEHGKPDGYKKTRWRKRLQFVDNTNLFPGKLSKLGESLGLEKLVMPKVSDSEEAWEVYCRRDVDIMVRAWAERLSFMRKHKLGTFKLTLASQAMSTYRYKFMSHKIHITRYDWQTALERESYRGGRVEPFFVGKVEGVKLYKLDVNSMYPAVMRNYEYPTGVVVHKHTATIADLRSLLQKDHAIARVVVKTDEPVYPVRMNDRNVYPTGQFETVLTTPELEYALDHNQIVSVGEVIGYKHAPIFKAYVDYFYNLRVEATEKGDTVARLMYKGLLNSAYGKWGQAGYSERVIGTCPTDDFRVEHGTCIPSGNAYTHKYLGGVVTETTRTGEAYNSFVAIASHVTAYARMYLWSLFCKAGRPNVYYCDTDSLFVNRAGYDNLINELHTSRLGALKLEGESDDVVLNAPKDYVWAGRPTLKGISKSAIEVRSYEYLMELWPSLKGHISRNQVDSFYNIPIVKRLKRSVLWGVKSETGWVMPFVLDNTASVFGDSIAFPQPAKPRPARYSTDGK